MRSRRRGRRHYENTSRMYSKTPQPSLRKQTELNAIQCPPLPPERAVTGSFGYERDAPVADTRRVTTANRVRCSAVGVRSRCPRFAEAEGVKA